jgi:hypothetical protein
MSPAAAIARIEWRRPMQRHAHGAFICEMIVDVTPPNGRPTAEQADARHGEIGKHHRKQRKRRAEERPSRPEDVRLAHLRWSELIRLMRHRYRVEMPPTDAARRDLAILLGYATLTGKKVQHIVGIWAPWIDEDELDYLAAQRPVLHKADDLAHKLDLYYCDRQALAIHTIGSVDVDQAERERLRRQRDYNERKRKRKAKQEEPMQIETTPKHDLSRRQAAVLEKVDGAEIATSNLMEQVRRHRAFRGVATDSLRIIVHRTLDQLLTMGLITDRSDPNPRGGRQIRYVWRQQ